MRRLQETQSEEEAIAAPLGMTGKDGGKAPSIKSEATDQAARHQKRREVTGRIVGSRVMAPRDNRNGLRS